MTDHKKNKAFLHVRVSHEEKDSYETAAKRENRVCADWIRQHLNRAAGRRSKRVTIDLSDAQAKHILTLISVSQDEGWYVGDKQRWRESLKEIESQVVQQIG